MRFLLFVLFSSRVLCGVGIAENSISVSDRIEIQDLISRYSHTWDSKDAGGWSDLFVKDGVWANYFAGKKNKSLGSGAERLAFAEKLQGSFRERGIVTRHHQTNTLLKKKEDGSIEGETVFSVIWQHHDEPLPKLMHSGIYRDIYVKTDEGWKFRVRVRLEGWAARVAAERRWHPSQDIKVKVAKGRTDVVEIAFELAGFEEITRWILSWGSLAEVISPKSLRNHVAKEIAGAAKRYQ